ncbi:MAG: electron transfer flavoprotein subunit alpha/FixB family protein, partial [Deltaproteobacteria bacterium]|nr:electron transfer flavoprotein subunit alpha/FixB family protein [Deltaproteobacteria bacterium]
MSKILVVADARGGEVRKGTLEQLSKIRAEGWSAEAVLVGSGVRSQADVLAGHGATTVYVADDPSLKDFLLAPYAQAVGEAVSKSSPGQVWLSASEGGKALGPYLAAKQQAGFLAEVTSVQGGNGKVVA